MVSPGCPHKNYSPALSPFHKSSLLGLWVVFPEFSLGSCFFLCFALEVKQLWGWLFYGPTWVYPNSHVCEWWVQGLPLVLTESHPCWLISSWLTWVIKLKINSLVCWTPLASPQKQDSVRYTLSINSLNIPPWDKSTLYYKDVRHWCKIHGTAEWLQVIIPASS